MKATELEELGFTYALTHWELNLDAPMLSGHRICLQYFESDQYKDAHLIVFLPFILREGDQEVSQFELNRIDNPTEFDARNLIRWLEVQRPDLQIKFDKL
jgi:hypothetical protein